MVLVNGLRVNLWLKTISAGGVWGRMDGQVGTRCCEFGPLAPETNWNVNPPPRTVGSSPLFTNKKDVSIVTRGISVYYRFEAS